MKSLEYNQLCSNDVLVWGSEEFNACMHAQKLNRKNYSLKVFCCNTAVIPYGHGSKSSIGLYTKDFTIVEP